MKTDLGNKMPQTKHTQVPTRTRGESTPGPWNFIEPQVLPFIITAPDGSEVGAVNCRRAIAGEATANARLIAASPDLLAACKELMDEVQWLIVEYHEPAQGDSGPDPHSVIMARAAIQKAQGQQPQGLRE